MALQNTKISYPILIALYVNLLFSGSVYRAIAEQKTVIIFVHEFQHGRSSGETISNIEDEGSDNLIKALTDRSNQKLLVKCFDNDQLVQVKSARRLLGNAPTVKAADADYTVSATYFLLSRKEHVPEEIHVVLKMANMNMATPSQYPIIHDFDRTEEIPWQLLARELVEFIYKDLGIPMTHDVFVANYVYNGDLKWEILADSAAAKLIELFLSQGYRLEEAELFDEESRREKPELFRKELSIIDFEVTGNIRIQRGIGLVTTHMKSKKTGQSVGKAVEPCLEQSNLLKGPMIKTAEKLKKHWHANVLKK